MHISQIVTHPGGAHKDEVLACALLLSQSPAPIQRREPTPKDLQSEETAVVDVGDLFEPERLNFDHHQFPRDHPPTCSLSLVLQHLGLYEDAKMFCDWLEPAEWFDSRGAVNTAKMLGVERDIIGKLNSPIDITLLRRFALAQRLEQGDPIWEMLRMIGLDLVEYLTSIRARIETLSEISELWQVPSAGNASVEILFVPRTEPLPQEPSAGIGQFVKAKQLEQSVVGMVYPDRRSSGYALSRFNDNLALDFTQIDREADVHFTHASGFLAKSTATEVDRLKQLVARSITNDRSV